MQGKSNFTLGALAIGVTLALSACGESTSSNQGSGFAGNKNDTVTPTPTSFDEAALVASLVDNVITPAFSYFAEQAQLQQQTISDYCNAEKASTDTSSAEAIAGLANAQQSWLSAMNAWQQVEMMQVGPLVSNNGELKNRIYSWPAMSRCGIDQDVVYNEDGFINKDTSRPYNITDRTATRRGLFALEHVLFSSNYDHHCSVANNALADWNSRTLLARKIARCEFATVAATDISNSAQELIGKWQGDSGFAQQLKTAGQTGSSFSTAHQALNHISDAIFYMDSIVKDKKLAIPLGLFANSCGTSVCPQDVESYDPKSSLANIKANLQALDALIKGHSSEDKLGFDDFLDDSQASSTKTKILTGISESLAAIDAIEGSLADALSDNASQVEQVHTKVKTVTDQLKYDFINELALELPSTSAGDND